ncbi:response regulator [bacterium]|nr:response regulator [bacterium]
MSKVPAVPVILVADDSATIRRVVESSFEPYGVRVVAVDDGRSAVAAAERERPDIVLCDVLMPGLSGYETAAAIHRLAGLEKVPILLLTGAFEPFDEGRANASGARGFLAKPFEPQALLRRVGETIGVPFETPAAPRGAEPRPAEAEAPPPAPAEPQRPPSAASTRPHVWPRVEEPNGWQVGRSPLVGDTSFDLVNPPVAPPAPAGPVVADIVRAELEKLLGGRIAAPTSRAADEIPEKVRDEVRLQLAALLPADWSALVRDEVRAQIGAPSFDERLRRAAATEAIATARAEAQKAAAEAVAAARAEAQKAVAGLRLDEVVQRALDAAFAARADEGREAARAEIAALGLEERIAAEVRRGVAEGAPPPAPPSPLDELARAEIRRVAQEMIPGIVREIVWELAPDLLERLARERARGERVEDDPLGVFGEPTR